jgi:serine/threonine protein kinase
LRSLYRICSRQALLPKSLVIPLCYNPMETPLCSGGFADVWKGRHHGREVAAKVLRVCLTSDFVRIRKVGYPRPDACVNGLSVSCTGVLQGGCGMEGPPPSQSAAAIRRDDDRDSVRDGIGVDDEWKHQPICEGGRQRRSVGACTHLVQGSYFHFALTIGSFPQLGGVTEGLIYMHDQGIIHGDLKGVRVPTAICLLHQLTRPQAQHPNRQ